MPPKPAKSLELQHTIRLIRELDSEINKVEAKIRRIMDQIQSPILTIPGISYRMSAMILAEIGDFSRFASPDKLLAYVELSPSTYQSGKLDNAHARMEKCGSATLAMHATTPQSTSIIGTSPSLPISPRSGRKATL